MRNESLKELVIELLSTKKEGEWWDFKREFTDNNAQLVHDIICMANQRSRNDAYIIYGIEDETFKVIGTENAPGRKNQQNVINLLNQVRFSGENRPEILLDTVIIDGHEVDVLQVINSNRVPFYLAEDYPSSSQVKVHKGYIYSRTGDTNTPIDKTSDYYVVELLWRKRFGLDLDIRQKLDIVLDDYSNWCVDWGNKTYAYNKIYPEFQLIYDCEFKDGWEPLSAFYLASDFSFVELKATVYNTIIYETELWVMDGKRKFLPKPSVCAVYLPDKKHPNFYFYYLLNSPEGKMLKILTNGSFNLSSREKACNQILIFNNEKEKEGYDSYYLNHYKDIDFSMLKEKYLYALENEKKAGADNHSFSAIHIAIAAELYNEWKKQ